MAFADNTNDTNKDDASFNKNKETFIDKKYYSLNNDYKKNITQLSGIRLSSIKLNWEKYLNKEDLPF